MPPLMASDLAADELPPLTQKKGEELNDIPPPEGPIWDTSNISWMDLQRRRWASLMLMRAVYYRLKNCEAETVSMQPNDPENEKIWNDAHRINAREIREHAEYCKGLIIKACQFMSSLAGTLPDPYTEEFLSLTDHLPVSLPEEVYRVIETDLGRPTCEIFERFDPVPIASASIAQVHTAQLRSGVVEGGDGMIVAVKIQHDGVDDVFMSDVNTLSTVVDQVYYWAPDLDFRKMAEEWRESLPRELDLREECRALGKARQALEPTNIPVVIPRAFPELVSKHVLVMEFVKAQPIMDLEDAAFCASRKLDKHKILETLMDAFGIMVFRAGMFHADPHAGNVRMILDKSAPGGAKPVLLDWGLFREITDSERLGLARLFHALANFDIAGLFDVLRMLGFAIKREAMTDEFRREFLDRARSLMKDTTTRQQTRDGVRMDMADHKERVEHAQTTLSSGNPQASLNPLWFLESWPPCIVFFMRMLQILRGLCVSVNADGMPILQIFTRHAREALLLHTTLPPTPLSPRTGSWTVGRLHSLRGEAALKARIQACLDRLLSQKRIVGAQVAIVRDSICVAEVQAGTLSTVDARPVHGGTRFPLLGAIGGVASLAALRSISRIATKHQQCSQLEEGDAEPLDACDILHGPLAELWPEFGNGDSSVTVADLLSHRVGLQGSFPADFGARHLDDVPEMIDHLQQVPLKSKSSEPRYAYPLQAYALAKLGDVLDGEDCLLHWIGSQLRGTGLDLAAPAGEGEEAAVCRDLPELSRVSLKEVNDGRDRRRAKWRTKEGSPAAGTSSLYNSDGDRKAIGLLDAIAWDPTAFDPLQANSGRGAQFRAGLSLGASATGLARMLSCRELQEELREMGALEPMPGADYTAPGWYLTGGANRWTAGGLQILDLKGRGARRLLGKRRQGYGVVCGLGPCVCHFPDVVRGGLTVAVTVNDVLRGRDVAAEVVAEVLASFGYTPVWPSMSVRVMADAARLWRSPLAAPLRNVRGLRAFGGDRGAAARAARGGCFNGFLGCCCCCGCCSSCCKAAGTQVLEKGVIH